MVRRTELDAAWLLVSALSFLSISSTLMAQQVDSNKSTAIGRYDRPSGPIHQSRSLVVARNGMACS
ncbi:MAG: hypothetical protein WCP62_17595, partial [Planctomycetota bacterium]